MFLIYIQITFWSIKFYLRPHLTDLKQIYTQITKARHLNSYVTVVKALGEKVGGGAWWCFNSILRGSLFDAWVSFWANLAHNSQNLQLTDM